MTLVEYCGRAIVVGIFSGNKDEGYGITWYVSGQLSVIPCRLVGLWAESPKRRCRRQGGELQREASKQVGREQRCGGGVADMTRLVC